MIQISMRYPPQTMTATKGYTTEVKLPMLLSYLPAIGRLIDTSVLKISANSWSPITHLQISQKHLGREQY